MMLPNELYTICTSFGDRFARINVISRSLLHLLDRNRHHVQPNCLWEDFHRTTSDSLQHTENMLSSAFSATKGIELALISHSPSISQDIQSQLEAAFHSLESARVSVQGAHARVLPAIQHPSYCTLSCRIERRVRSYAAWLDGVATSRTSFHHDNISLLYRQLGDELLRLEEYLGHFNMTVLRDLVQVVEFYKVVCDDLHQHQTTAQTIRHLLTELSSGIMWLTRQNSDFMRLNGTKQLIPSPLWDLAEQSLDDWAGVTAHKNYHQLEYIGKHTRFPYLFEKLLYLRNSIPYHEYAGFLTAALSIAIPVRSDLRSAFVAEDGSFTHNALARVFGEVDPVPIYDIVDPIGPSRGRMALVNLDFSLRRNIRHINYWIEHIGGVINAIETKSAINLGLTPTSTFSAVFSVVMQAAALGMCYFLQERQIALIWVAQYTALAISYLSSLYSVIGGAKRLGYLPALAPLVTGVWAISRLCIFLTGFLSSVWVFPSLEVYVPFGVGCFALYLMLKMILLQRHWSQSTENGCREMTITLRLVALQLQELSHASRELLGAIDSISQPFQRYRLDTAQRHHIFVTFFDEYVGNPHVGNHSLGAHPRSWHFGGLTPFVKTAHKSFTGGMTHLRHCPTTHPDIWMPKSMPNRNCELCAQRRRPLMRSSVDNGTDETGRYLMPTKVPRASDP